MFILFDATSAGVLAASSNSTAVTVTWNGATVNWYNTASDVRQMNITDLMYDWVAIG